MSVQFLGAARQVSGSQYLVRTERLNFLIDCGMYQEREYQDRNWQPFVFPPAQLDAVLLTHAHVDHCGRLPRLVREGFRGPIHATAPTVELAALLLRDAAHIQEEDAAYKAKRHRKEGRRGKHPEVPLYTAKDVERALPQLQPTCYGQPVELGPGVSATFYDAGHILGSAMIELRVREAGGERTIVFSGDLGQHDKPIIADPTMLHEADLVVMESTYGDRDHPAEADVETQLAEIITRTVGRGGNVIIPVFAVERAQELTYHLSWLVRQGRIPRVDVFLNSPMAVDVTEVFHRYRDYHDEETRAMVGRGESPFSFPGFRLVRDMQESIALHDHPRPAVIMATSGMCTAGRIKHHLKHNITRPESTILFVGYQAANTLGRQILEKPREVRIHGRMWPMRAEVRQIEGFSGHADRRGLLRWLAAFQKPRRVCLTHGEASAAESLAREIRQRYGCEVIVPAYQQEVEWV